MWSLVNIYLFLSFPGRVGFGLNPVEGESEPEELEDAVMGFASMGSYLTELL